MSFKKLHILSICYFFCTYGFSQIHNFQNVSQAELLSFIEKCEKINWSKPQRLDNYLNCASAYSESFNQQRAIRINESAKTRYPYNYELRLQHAILLSSNNSIEKAEKDLIGLIRLYPQREDLHNVVARINFPHNRIKSALGFMLNLAMNPYNKNARENRAYLRMLLQPGRLKVSRQNKDNPAPQKSKDIMVVGLDNFSQAEYVLENTAHSPLNEVDMMLKRIRVMIVALEKTSSAKHGFFWDNYVRFFSKLNDEDLLETYVHYIHQDIKSSKNWLKDNPSKTKQFLSFKNEYNFNK